jgi:hypothetical protein
MSRTQTRLTLWTLLLCLLWGLSAGNLRAGPQETPPSEGTTSSSKKEPQPKTASPASNTAAGKKSSSRTSGQGSASAEEIAAAKASGKVWVNLDSGAYHKSGRWYGKTKNGRFMSEAEAKQGGYRESKRQ